MALRIDRGGRLLAAALVALLAAPRAGAQELEARVRGQSGDAVVRFASRPGVCGNGEGGISLRTSLDDSGDDGWRCEPGPVRVRFTVRGGVVTAIRTTVGPPGAPAAAADLGRVGDHEAVAYLLSLARTADAQVAAAAVMPAALADSIDVTPPLLALAATRDRPTDVRKRALFWAGEVGDSTVVPAALRIACDTTDDQRLREHAVFVLSQRPDGAGVPSLAALAGSDDPSIAAKATFWLGQSRDPRADTLVRGLVTAPGVPDAVREQAVFVLGQHDAGDQAFLRSRFDSLGENLQRRVLMGVAQHGGDGGTDWLIAVARDRARPIEVRRQALFWLGQSHDPRVARFLADILEH